MNKNKCFKRVKLIVFIILLNSLFVRISFALTPEEYLQEIIDFQIYAVENGMPLDSYLQYTKPYSIWDSRLKDEIEVINYEGIDMDTTGIPNFIWGIIGYNLYNMSEKEVLDFPGKFVRKAWAYKAGAVAKAKKKDEKKKILNLIKQIQSSDFQVFVTQDHFKRIDDVFCFSKEGLEGECWKYILSPKSPFRIAGDIETLENYKYEENALGILDTMLDRGFYCAVKQQEIVILMPGGLLDNSWGFIYSEKRPEAKSLGPLYELVDLEAIGDNLYFYISH